MPISSSCSTYYMLLPLRDAMGIEGGTRNLPWLFTATFAATLITAPLQAAVAAKLPRLRFVPVIYLFLVANMLVFWLLLRAGVSPVGRVRARSSSGSRCSPCSRFGVLVVHVRPVLQRTEQAPVRLHRGWRITGHHPRARS